MNLLSLPARQNAALPEDPEIWPIVKDFIKEKLKNRSSASSNKSSTNTFSENSSIHSTVSNATTLKESVAGNKKKWYSLSPKSKIILTSDHKYIKDSDKKAAVEAVHNQAVASYLTMR
ncbi:hypothetical protein N7520_007193 [Penicillium odoratum]|uniref:uncharacterized protein n=1 Tax=Penicillium odoratum TaxID=1167516 RepID=UPI0025489F0B|nr:uncharacterized protein N7520_007193 [Penicillium odoratum]KAJ5760037.1 hypothetical protein N7520_007193 [Penicillium odoratum]